MGSRLVRTRSGRTFVRVSGVHRSRDRRFRSRVVLSRRGQRPGRRRVSGVHRSRDRYLRIPRGGGSAYFSLSLSLSLSLSFIHIYTHIAARRGRRPGRRRLSGVQRPRGRYLRIPRGGVGILLSLTLSVSLCLSLIHIYIYTHIYIYSCAGSRSIVRYLRSPRRLLLRR